MQGSYIGMFVHCVFELLNIIERFKLPHQTAENEGTTDDIYVPKDPVFDVRFDVRQA